MIDNAFRYSLRLKRQRLRWLRRWSQRMEPVGQADWQDLSWYHICKLSICWQRTNGHLRRNEALLCHVEGIGSLCRWHDVKYCPTNVTHQQQTMSIVSGFRTDLSARIDEGKEMAHGIKRRSIRRDMLIYQNQLDCNTSRFIVLSLRGFEEPPPLVADKHCDTDGGA